MQDVSDALQHSKAVYRALYEELQQEKQELAQSVESLNRLKHDFQDRFCSWYKTSYVSKACKEDHVGHDVAGNGTGCAAGDVVGNVASAHMMEGNSHANGLPQASMSGTNRASDYNDETRKFYDAQRKLVLSAKCPSHSKLRDFGKGWRISG